ncbi:hypothetical protein BV20DRAFT_952257 [Pilatotrama ljubarskyi]|nr:hypothetical protein BV20DRAFT_952257 [Pilatotrama ljubarskyi]
MSFPPSSTPITSSTIASPTFSSVASAAAESSSQPTGVNTSQSSQTAGRGSLQADTSSSPTPVPSTKALEPNSPAPHGAAAVPASSNRSAHIGTIIGAVLGCLAAIAIAALAALCIARRRRRRRAKEAMLPSGPLDWWRRPPGPADPPSANPEPSESSTVIVDDLDDLETLDCGDVPGDKKTVTYGEYPD